MDKITLLKKFRTTCCLISFWSLRALIGSMVLLNLLALTVRAADRKIPVLSHLGILPLQFIETESGSSPEFARSIKRIEASLHKVFDESKRFNLIHPQLVRDLWDSPTGRSTLQEKYRLSAFCVVDLEHDDVTAKLTLRFLGPDLQPMLQESESWATSEILGSSREELHHHLAKLVFRVINRIPTDATITSVQGKYLTLSAGKEQGFSLGDKLNIERIFLADRHPVLGTWRSFRKSLIGTAIIIDLKDTVAVAELKSLVVEGEIEVGDGVSSQLVPSRKLFAAAVNKVEVGSTDSQIVIDSHEEIANKHEFQKSAVNSKVQEGASHSTAVTSKKTERSHGERLAGDSGLDLDKLAGENMDDLKKHIDSLLDFEIGNPSDAAALLRKLADDVVISFGQQGWGYTGLGSTGSRTTWYLPINQIEARVTRKVTSSIKYGFGGGFGTGKNQKGKGSYQSYDGHARLYWESQVQAGSGFVKLIRLGGHSAVNGLGVHGTEFGGYDAVIGGVFVGANGLVPSDFSGVSIDWYGEFNLTPLTLGRVGYGSKQHYIRSSLGWKILGGGYLNSPRSRTQWGAGFSYGRQSILDGSSRESVISRFDARALWRWNF